MSILPLPSRLGAEAKVQSARAIQPAWTARGLRDRARVIKSAARLLAREAEVMTAAIATAAGRPERCGARNSFPPWTRSAGWRTWGARPSRRVRSAGRSSSGTSGPPATVPLSSICSVEPSACAAPMDWRSRLLPRSSWLERSCGC